MADHFPILQPGSRVCICGHPEHVHPMQVEQDMCRPDPATRAQMAISELVSATSDLEDNIVELQRIVSAIATASDGDGPAVLRNAIRLARQYMARIEGLHDESVADRHPPDGPVSVHT